MTLSFTEHLADVRFAVIGHRGAAGIAPENTIKSFAAAVQLGCAAIELDVFASRYVDGSPELLVIHDDSLNRTTNASGFVGDFDVEYLRSLDAGDDERIPLLAEVIALLDDHRVQQGLTVGLNIELKGPNTAAPIAQSARTMDSIPVLVSSFNHRELATFRELQPACEVAPLFSRYRDDWAEIAGELGAVAININRKIVTEERVDAIRSAGYAVFVYTINTQAEAARLEAMGVSGVFSDRPDLLLSQQ